ncbi:MAG: dihydrolipoyl dehydrogenase [Halobacteriovoraceae bacterium]|nr:dihydrolipoyl dehydrogenase [Halobacteriovoraceae bacterium]|tara:strand:- start:23870 stop:25261 length:1392 start_codon:yes stop_codon:yes gene_type:complete
MKKYDVVIIGAGSGGLSARREVAKKTDNYLVVDGGVLGTTCARVGCMPSKVLIQVAQDFNRRHKFSEQGIHGHESLEVNTKEVMLHVRKLRDRFVRGVLGGMQDWKETHFKSAIAEFVNPHTLRIGEETIQADKIIVATGSKPNLPPPLEGCEEFCVNTDQFFELEDLPKRWAVLGLGVIGLELGQSLHRLGLEVTGIARRQNIAGITDPELNTYVIKKFSEEMNLTFNGLKGARKSSSGLVLDLGDREIEVDKVLVTAGRYPCWDSVRGEVLGFKGQVPDHDPHTFQLVDHEHIFIAGDNTGEYQILHEASDEGKIAGFNAVNPLTKFRRRTPLMITFSDPNIAFSGKTYKELIDLKIDFAIGEVSFEGQGRSIVKLKENGLLRVYGDKKSGKLIGAEMMGPSCEHIAHLLSWVIDQDLTVNQVLALPFYHPVIEEGLRTALRDLRDKVEEPSPVLEIFPCD